MLMAERVFPSIAGSVAWGITGMIQAKMPKRLGIGEKDEKKYKHGVAHRKT